MRVCVCIRMKVSLDCPFFLSFYGALLLALHPLFGSEEEDAVKDNAAGSVARLVSAAAGQAGQAGLVPLDRVLPVLLSALPLKEDLEVWRA